MIYQDFGNNMRINIKATKIELTEDLRNYIQLKMDMLDKYLGKMKVINCDVEVGMAVGSHHKGQIYRAEVNLEIPGKLIRIEKQEKEIKKAIDKVKDHLQISIKKYKEKLIQKSRKN
jgi:putative sigma-54 modulation protein